MNVAQAQSQYETAAAQIPQIESADRAARERAVGAARPQSRADRARQDDLRAGAAASCLRACPRSCSSAAPISCSPSSSSIARQRADRRRKGALLPDDLPDRRARQRERRSVESVHGTGARVELCRAGDRADLHVRRGQRPGRAGRGWAAGRAATSYQFSIQNAFADVDNALVASEKLKEQLAAQQRLVDALSTYARLARAAVHGRLHVVHDGAAGGTIAVPGRAHAGGGPHVAARVERRGSTRRWAAAGSSPQPT